jgi:hypothetical protein
MFVDTQELTFYYTDRTFIDEPQYASSQEKILLDDDLNSDRTLQFILDQGFSKLQLNEEGDLDGCVLNFEHLDEWVLKKERAGIDVRKKINVLDTYEGFYSLNRGRALYEYSMRNYDAGWETDGSDEENDELNMYDGNVPSDYVYRGEHPYGCDCEECFITSCQLKEMHEIHYKEDPAEQLTDNQLIEYRVMLMQQAREARLNKRRRARQQRRARRSKKGSDFEK